MKNKLTAETIIAIDNQFAKASVFGQPNSHLSDLLLILRSIVEDLYGDMDTFNNLIGDAYDELYNPAIKPLTDEEILSIFIKQSQRLKK
jgi:hypothetical protein